MMNALLVHLFQDASPDELLSEGEATAADGEGFAQLLDKAHTGDGSDADRARQTVVDAMLAALADGDGDVPEEWMDALENGDLPKDGNLPQDADPPKDGDRPDVALHPVDGPTAGADGGDVPVEYHPAKAAAPFADASVHLSNRLSGEAGAKGQNPTSSSTGDQKPGPPLQQVAEAKSDKAKSADPKAADPKQASDKKGHASTKKSSSGKHTAVRLAGAGGGPSAEGTQTAGSASSDGKTKRPVADATPRPAQVGGSDGPARPADPHASRPTASRPEAPARPSAPEAARPTPATDASGSARPPGDGGDSSARSQRSDLASTTSAERKQLRAEAQRQADKQSSAAKPEPSAGSRGDGRPRAAATMQGASAGLHGQQGQSGSGASFPSFSAEAASQDLDLEDLEKARAQKKEAGGTKASSSDGGSSEGRGDRTERTLPGATTDSALSDRSRSTTRAGRASSFTTNTRSAAWARAMAQQQAATTTTDNGWKSLEMRLKNGDGLLTVETQRSKDRLSVNVGFTDSRLRSLAAASASQIQDALQSQFDTDVDLSLMQDGAEDSPSRRRGSSPNSRSAPSPAALLAETDSALSDGPSARAIAAGAQHEWVG